MFIAGTIPFLIATFGMLHVFYRFFHPWKSEGVSVGFEPGRELRNDMMDDIYELREKNDDIEQPNRVREREIYGMQILSILVHKF